MHRFNYIIIPALFLINMGVDGATIANTLTSAHHPIRDSARGVALLQNRQYRVADFSSVDPASTTDQPALPEAADSDDHPQDISRQDFLPRGSVFPSRPLGDGGVSAQSKRADRPVVNFRQLLHRADSGDNEEICDHVLPTSFERRLDPGFSTNVMSDVLPNGSARPISTSDLPTSNLPASDPPTSNLPASNPFASNLPAGTFGSSPMSNAVGTSNLMNSALGSGGVQDELSNLGAREIALSHGMGRNLEMSPRDDAAEGLHDIVENADEDNDADEDDAEDDGLESRQRTRIHRLSPPRLRERPHLHHGPDVAVPSKVAKAAQAMKQKELETTGKAIVKKKSHGVVMEGVQDVHGAAAVF